MCRLFFNFCLFLISFTNITAFRKQSCSIGVHRLSQRVSISMPQSESCTTTVYNITLQSRLTRLLLNILMAMSVNIRTRQHPSPCHGFSAQHKIIETHRLADLGEKTCHIAKLSLSLGTSCRTQLVV